MAHFTITIPDTKPEISSYIVNVIFNDWLGQTYEIIKHEKWEYQIALSSDLTKKFSFSSEFLKLEMQNWLNQREQGFWRFKKDEKSITGYELKKSGFDNKESISNDFFGMIFFFINRYHELTENLELDSHGRYLEDQTLLIRDSHINKAVSEHILKSFCTRLKTELNVDIYRKSEFQILPSHDVDVPFEYLYFTIPRLLKRCIGDIVRRKSITKALNRLELYGKVNKQELNADPYNTFEWIMKESEKRGVQSVFHFIAQNTNIKYDQKYDLSNPEIKDLFLEISNRGHLLALHPSYNSSIMNGQVKREREIFTNQLYSLSIRQEFLKSRFHYLRWNENCISELEFAEIDIDQTLGFARRPGFRCGTARAFRPFNFAQNKAANLIIEPLIVMEASLIGVNYLNLANNLDKAWDLVSTLKEECKINGGNFTVLWHNNNFEKESFKEFYKACIN